MAFDLHSKKNIIIVVVFIVILAGAGVWFFLYRMPHNVEVVSQVSGEVAQIESPDDIRMKHMKLIEKSVTALLQRGEKLPLPQKAFDFRLKEIKIGYQGIAGNDFYDAIGLTNLLDPVTQLPYNYYVSADRTEYKIFAYLKDEANRTGTLGDKSIFSVGTLSGDFLLSSNGDIVSSPGTKLDLLDDVSRKQVGFDTLKSCKDILTLVQPYSRPKSGIHYIDIDGRETKVYCDMQTDGGGWTLFYANNGHEKSPIQKSYVQMREALSVEPVLDLSNYDDINLAGLLDYSSFTRKGSKEILIRNRTGDFKKWVKFSFSVSRALEWALGPDVLGKTEAGCIELPRRATWSIVNNDGKIKYYDLQFIMNNQGRNWGVSSKDFICNNLLDNILPFLGFFSATDSSFEKRARSNGLVGGIWGPDNEYRYFIR